jgi:hypothetical protein
MNQDNLVVDKIKAGFPDAIEEVVDFRGRAHAFIRSTR